MQRSVEAADRLSRVYWAAATAVSAAACAVIVVRQPLLLLLAVGAALIVWRPAVMLTVALITCQELDPNAGFSQSGSPLLVFGNQLYFSTVGKFTALELVVVLAAFAALGHWARVLEHRPMPARALGVVLAGAFLVAAVTYLQGFAVTSVINQYARPWLMCALCLVVGATVDAQPGGRRAVARAGAASLIAVALVGAYVFATGGGATLLEGSNLVFYDSVLPTMAGSVLLVMVLRMVNIPRRWAPYVMAATAVIVILSFRRNVWTAVVLVLLLGVLIRRNRMKVLAWTGGVVAAAWVGLLAFDPALLGVIGDRGVSWLVTLNSGTADQSLTGHVNDIALGWQYAWTSPSFFGWGPNHGPLPGLFAQGQLLYVHNEYLFDWIKYGALGLLAVLLPVISGLWVGVRVLRRPQMDGLSATAGVLLVIAPLCAFTAAFFTATSRWPALLGLAAGALLVQVRADADRSTGGGTPDPVGPHQLAERGMSRTAAAQAVDALTGPDQ